jgi:hypothetical protein
MMAWNQGRSRHATIFLTAFIVVALCFLAPPALPTSNTFLEGPSDAFDDLGDALAGPGQDDAPGAHFSAPGKIFSGHDRLVDPGFLPGSLSARAPPAAF